MTDDKKDILETDDILSNDSVENDFSTDLDDVFDDLSDDLNDFDNDVDYEFPQAPSKQSSMNWFNIAIIGVVIVAIGGAAFMFLGGGSSQPMPAADAQQEQQLLVSSEQISRDLVQEAVSQDPIDALQDNGGLLNNPDFLLDQENKAAAALTADVINTDELFQKIDNNQIEFSDNDVNDLFAAIPDAQMQSPRPPEMQAAPVVAVEQVTQNLPTPSDNQIIVAEEDKIPVFEAIPDLNTIYEEFVPLVQEELKSEEVKSTEVNEVEEVAPVTMPEPSIEVNEPVVVSSSTNDSEVIAKLNARIEELSRQVENLQNTNPPPAVSIDMSAVQSQLSAIEQRIDNLAKTQKSSASSSKAASKTTTKSAPKKYEPAYVPPPRERKPVLTTTWTLRGASPGQAILAQQGTNTVRTVNVGETIDGLGRIQSVAVENGKWVVRGTSGTVSQ